MSNQNLSIYLSLIFFILFPFLSKQITTYALIVRSEALNNNQTFRMEHAESYFCTAPPLDPLDLEVVYVDNVALCDNSTALNINVTGKAALFQDGGGCLKYPKMYRLYTLGAALIIGFYTDVFEPLSPGALFRASATYAVPTIPVPCLGISFTNGGLIRDANSSVIVTTYQKPLQASQKPAIAALIKVFANQQNPWINYTDICTTTLVGQYPSRPAEINCQEDGMISYLYPDTIPINGTLPEELGLFTELFFVDLSRNQNLTGALPLSFKNFTKILTFVVSMCSLTYADASIFDTWTRVVMIAMSDNKLTSTLPDSYPETLVSFNVANNQLTGEIHPNAFRKTTLLKGIDVAFNNFTGKLPDFSQCTSLITLYAGSNHFTGFAGALPPSVQQLTLSNNGLSHLPENVSLVSLYSLDLSFNNFTTFPNFAAATPYLQELHMDYNQISGYVNTSLFPQFDDGSGVLQSYLTFLYINNNQITGFGDWKLFYFLSKAILNSNNLTTFPQFYDNTNLIELDLSNNQLNDTIFDILARCPKQDMYLYFKFFRVRNNQITGGIDEQAPPFKTYMNGANEIDISFNRIKSDLPTYNALPLHISRLYISNNDFSGTLTREFGLLYQLVDLQASSNARLYYGGPPNPFLPDSLTYDFNSSTSDFNRGIECPAFKLKRDPLARVALDHTYHDYQLCRCLPGYYRFSTDAFGWCRKCLDNAVCPGWEHILNDLSQNLNIVPNHGYYPTPAVVDPQAMLACEFGVVRPSDVENPCNKISVPIANLTKSFECAQGSTDRLCSRCEHGYFSKNGKCYLCDQQAAYPTFLILLILVLCFMATYFLFPRQVDTRADKALAMELVPLVIDFFQTISIITSRHDSPDVIRSLQSAIGMIAVSPSASGLGIECIAGFPDFSQEYLYLISGPGFWVLIMLILFGLKWLVMHFIQKRKIDFRRERNLIIRGILSICGIVYFPIVTAILTVFGCTEDIITKEKYLTDRPYMLCSSISIQQKVVPLIIYLIGIYVVFATLSIFVASSKARRHDQFYMEIFGFFYQPYHVESIYAGVVFMFIRLGLAIVVALAPFKRDFYALFIVWLLMIKLFFIIFFRPYHFHLLNAFETTSTSFAIFLFLNSVAYSSTLLFTRTVTAAVTWFLLVLFLVILAICISVYDSLSAGPLRKYFLSIGVSPNKLPAGRGEMPSPLNSPYGNANYIQTGTPYGGTSTGTGTGSSGGGFWKEGDQSAQPQMSPLPAGATGLDVEMDTLSKPGPARSVSKILPTKGRSDENLLVDPPEKQKSISQLQKQPVDQIQEDSRSEIEHPEEEGKKQQNSANYESDPEEHEGGEQQADEHDEEKAHETKGENVNDSSEHPQPENSTNQGTNKDESRASCEVDKATCLVS